MVRWRKEGGVEHCHAVETAEHLEGEVALLSEAVGRVREYRRGELPVASWSLDVVEGPVESSAEISPPSALAEMSLNAQSEHISRHPDIVEE